MANDGAGARNFGGWLKHYRIIAGLTQEELAERAGLSVHGISDLERGARRWPRRDTIRLLAEALHLSPAEHDVLAAAARRGASAATPQEPQQPQQHAWDIPRSEPIWKMPIFLTPLIGREPLVGEVCALLSRAEARLLTLVGTGGIGKTRVAIQVANELRSSFADGVCFVPLATINDPALVVPAIAQQLGLQEQPERSTLALVQQWLREKHFLLVLDNFEQVVAAGTYIKELYAGCPRLKVLVTSRAALHVQGEQVFPVPPLALPDPHHLPDLIDLANCPAIALFLHRAQAVKPDVTLTPTTGPAVAEICAQLDGLPLAIELAAARSRILPPRALLQRLNRRLALLTGGPQDAPPRQQTLQNTIAWSYDLLTPQAQVFFRRLAVFAGGFDLEAAEQVCATTNSPDLDALDGVTTLVESNLLWQEETAEGESRFGMLETIREYGLDCLRDNGETEALRRAHALYYLALAERVEPHLRGGGEQLRWITLLRLEQENIRAALQQFIESEETALALRLCVALWWYWFMSGYHNEALHWLEATLALSAPATAQPGTPSALRAQALTALGVMTLTQGRLEEGQALLEASLAQYRELGDQRGCAHTLQFLAWVPMRQGDLTMARSLIEDGLNSCRALGDTWQVGMGMNDLAMVLCEQGEEEAARKLLEECLALSQEIGEKWTLPRTQTSLAVLLLAQGDYEQATALCQEALLIARQMGDLAMLPELVAFLAEIVRYDDDKRAMDLIQEGFAVARDLGNQYSLSVFHYLIGDIARRQGQVQPAIEHFRASLTLVQRNASARMIVAKCLLGLAKIASSQGDIQEAARFFAAAEARLNVRVDMHPRERREYEQDVATLRARLGEEQFAASWAQGHLLTLQQAIAAVMTETLDPAAMSSQLVQSAQEATGSPH